MTGQFGRLLDVLGINPAENISVCYVPVGTEDLKATMGTAQDAPGRVQRLDPADVWFGVSPLLPGVAAGCRGTEEQVARIPAVWADLDAKPAPAGMGSTEGCQDVVDELSALLRAQPIAVVGSGTGGLHPYWKLAPYPDADHGRAVALLRRFGRLVKTVAADQGGGADSVFDPPRILRVPGTVNFKPGGGMVTVTFPEDDGTEPDELSLDQLQDALDLAGVPVEVIREVGEVVDMSTWPTATTTCSYVTAMVAGWKQDVPKGGRHQWLLGQSVRLAAACRRGCITAEDLNTARSILKARFRIICNTVGEIRRDPGVKEVSSCWTWAVEKVETMTEEDLHSNLGKHRHPGEIDKLVIDWLGNPNARLEALQRLLDDLRTWQHLPDPTHVIAALAAAVTRTAAGEPVWLLLVAAPSSGKTEAVRILDDAADARLDEVTAAGLIGWGRGKPPKPTGVLTRIGSTALVTFGDLSTLLATSDRGGRDQVFSLLRRVYDGHVVRDISTPAGSTADLLEWSGRLTVVGCVTGAIDRYTTHADQLGARWVYVRLPERKTEDKRAASALARRGGLAEARAAARKAAAALLAATPQPDLNLHDDVAQVIEDAALVTAWGRAIVPRNGYGRREIEGVPVVEEPMRLVQQLGALAAGVRALGLPDQVAGIIARRVALDSMPEARRAVLAALANAHFTGEEPTTAAVARNANLHRHVARHQLEELAAIGVVAHDRDDDADDDLVGVVHWSLAGADGALIAQVFFDHRNDQGWHEKEFSPTPPPPIKG